MSSLAGGYDIAIVGGSEAVAELSQLSEPTLVVLVRHFACNCSADRLQEVLSAMRAAGLASALPLLVIASSPSPAPQTASTGASRSDMPWQ